MKSTKRLPFTLLILASMLLAGCQAGAPPIGGASQAPAIAGFSASTPLWPLWQKILYVHPAGSPDAPGTAARPTTLAVALQKLSAGGVIHLQTDAGRVTDYRAPLVLTGRSDLNVYGVGTGYPLFQYVQLTNCRDVQLSRVCAGPSAGTVFALTDCTNVKLMQCVGRNAAAGNCMVFGLNRCNGVTFDGCYGFGTGRKIFQFYKSKNIIVARCFGSGGNYRGGYGNDQTPTMAYSTAYNTYNIDFVQCWGTWDEKAGKPAGAVYGIFGVDGNEALKYPEWPYGANIKVRYCTAYTLPGQNVTGMIGASFHTGLSDVAFSNCNSIVSHAIKPYFFGLKAWGGERCNATDFFAKGGLKPSASANWTVTLKGTPNPLPPVLPWPAAAMKLLGGPDLVKDVAQLKLLIGQG